MSSIKICHAGKVGIVSFVTFFAFMEQLHGQNGTICKKKSKNEASRVEVLQGEGGECQIASFLQISFHSIVQNYANYPPPSMVSPLGRWEQLAKSTLPQVDLAKSTLSQVERSNPL